METSNSQKQDEMQEIVGSLPPRETRIDILKHFHHLVFVPKQEHTSVFSRLALYLGHYCINNGSFEGISRVSPTR